MPSTATINIQTGSVVPDDYTSSIPSPYSYSHISAPDIAIAMSTGGVVELSQEMLVHLTARLANEIESQIRHIPEKNKVDKKNRKKIVISF
jgi:hypothetical protein